MNFQNSCSGKREFVPFESERNQSRFTSAAMWRYIKSSIAGIVPMLLACFLYLRFGPTTIGRPMEHWAHIIFSLGIFTSEFLFCTVNFPLKACMCGDVLEMSLIGGLFGCIWPLRLKKKVNKKVIRTALLVVLLTAALPSKSNAQFNDQREATPETIQQYISKLESQVLFLEALKSKASEGEKMYQTNANIALLALRAEQDQIASTEAKLVQSKTKAETDLLSDELKLYRNEKARSQNAYNDAKAGAERERVTYFRQLDANIAKINQEIADWRRKLVQLEVNQIQAISQSPTKPDPAKQTSPLYPPDPGTQLRPIAVLYLKNTGKSTGYVWVNGTYQGCVGPGEICDTVREGFVTRDSGWQPDGTLKVQWAQGGWQDSDPLEVVIKSFGSDGSAGTVYRNAAYVRETDDSDAWVWFDEYSAQWRATSSGRDLSRPIHDCGKPNEIPDANRGNASTNKSIPIAQSAIIYISNQNTVPNSAITNLLSGLPISSSSLRPRGTSQNGQKRSPQLSSQLPQIDQALWASLEWRAREISNDYRMAVPRAKLESLLKDVREFMADQKDFIDGSLLQARLALLLNHAPEGIAAEISLNQFGARETGDADILATLRQLDEHGW